METKVCFFGWEGAPATMNDVTGIGRFKRLVTILGITACMTAHGRVVWCKIPDSLLG